MTEFGAIVAGGALAALLLAAAHLSLWEKRGRLWLVWRYTIGVACLNAGATLAGGLLDNWQLAVIPWCIALVGGALVAGLHLWRERRDGAAATALLRRTFKEFDRGAERETGGPDARADR